MFTVTMQEGCYNNVIKFDGTYAANKSLGTAAIPNQVYKINGAGGSPTLTLVPLYSTYLDATACPLTANFYIWNPTTNVWVDSSTTSTQPFTNFN